MNNPQHVEMKGVKCFAPAMADACADYPKEIFEKLAEIEDSHFWFRSRNTVIRHLVGKYLGVNETRRRFLEIGCGTGYVLKMLAANPALECMGAEIHLEGALIAKERVPAAEIIQLDATRIPFEDHFDGIGAFAVIEHIEPDEAVIQNIYRALKPGGCFFLSVPQHRFLWSFQDEFSGHKRRYNRADLVSMLTRNNFHIDYVGSFCCFLFPLMLLVRLTKARPNKEKMASVLEEFRISAPVNRILRAFMRPEELLISRGWSLPFGGSLLVVARKSID